MRTSFARLLLLLALAAALLPARTLAAGLPAKAPQRFLSPAGSAAAVFGPGAREVSVFSLRGRLVFRQAQNGAAPIVWNGRDGSGAVVPTGVYIARIRTADAGVVYQSFVVVK